MAMAKAATKLDANGIPLVRTARMGESEPYRDWMERTVAEAEDRAAAIAKLVKRKVLAAIQSAGESAPECRDHKQQIGGDFSISFRPPELDHDSIQVVASRERTAHMNRDGCDSATVKVGTYRKKKRFADRGEKGHNLDAIVAEVIKGLAELKIAAKHQARSEALEEQRRLQGEDRQRFIESVRRDFPGSFAEVRQEYGRFVVSVPCGEDRDRVQLVMTLLKPLKPLTK